MTSLDIIPPLCSPFSSTGQREHQSESAHPGDGGSQARPGARLPGVPSQPYLHAGLHPALQAGPAQTAAPSPRGLEGRLDNIITELYRLVICAVRGYEQRWDPVSCFPSQSVLLSHLSSSEARADVPRAETALRAFALHARLSAHLQHKVSPIAYMPPLCSQSVYSIAHDKLTYYASNK